MTTDDCFKNNAVSRRYTVLGFDSFEYFSDPDASNPWYEIAVFDTESAAVARAWSRLRRWKPVQIEDWVYIMSPNGDRQRCLIRYCRECGDWESMRPTGRKRRAGLAHFFRVISWEYACLECQSRDWRDRNQIFLLGPVDAG